MKPPRSIRATDLSPLEVETIASSPERFYALVVRAVDAACDECLTEDIGRASLEARRTATTWAILKLLSRRDRYVELREPPRWLARWTASLPEVP